ncbi:killer toxin Kp4/SMK [Fusarium flagelliforme]|uniref:killer toxin Kp4/SMK n=1 Tax=Fusarium flagelliforme TaxID=2675880 RepID=UPI001E8D78F9|nr:killer toxin Kp4/SMK [Fusarium flagelliforme]KAH7186243.1 killer toxin Kp4/SMK [Fusarium flagelliforme]
MFKYAILALAATASLSEALGINCRGSGLCVGNKGAITQMAGQLRVIDSSKTFSAGEHITCVEIDNIGDPSICLFYQQTGDLRFTVAETQALFQQILDHGCKLCGSVPLDGRDVKNGELTVNAVTNAKKLVPAPVPAPAPAPSGFAKRSLGINCRGSSSCGVGGIFHLPNHDMKDVRDAVAAGEEGNWANGEHVACVPFAFGQLCAFYQGIGSRTFSKQQTVTYLDELLEHKCDKCGSIPTDPGNNVANGQLTVNYVA